MKKPSTRARMVAYARMCHELIRPDNGRCNQCGGHWLFRTDGTYDYTEGEHTPSCIGRRVIEPLSLDRGQIVTLLTSVLEQWERHFGNDYPESAFTLVMAVPEILNGERIALLREDVREELLDYMYRVRKLEIDIEVAEQKVTDGETIELHKMYRTLTGEAPANATDGQSALRQIVDALIAQRSSGPTP